MNNLSKLFIFLLLGCLSFPVAADNKNDILPIDSAIRIGKLKNGLTYYIRKNTENEHKADFYIAQKVGSMQEEEHQRGLAHFLEHMCFNGTEKFPDNTLREYLENIGVKFGVNLNAYTSFDETVYNINNVPINIEGAIDSCLWILHDWADGLLLDPKEIDKERGVIHEEWRQSTSANMRMMEKILPVMYSGNRYGERLPIGLMSVVDNFPYQALRDYYEKWYRPDLQGIIIVGDIDVDDIEKRIKKIFSKIKKAKKPAERIYHSVADNKEMIFAQATDKEQQNYTLRIMYKHDAMPRELRNTKEAQRKNACRSIALGLLNQRFSEIITKDNPPYSSAGVGYGNYMVSSTKDAFTIMVNCKPEQVFDAIPFVLTEVERARRHGFTASELEREKKSLLSGIELSYSERNNQVNTHYVNKCVRHFLDNAPLMSAETNYEISKEIIASLTLEDINAVLPSLFRDNNIAIYSMAPEREDIQYPGENDIKNLFSMIANARIAPYVDDSNDAPLLAEIPEGRKIATTETGKWGETVWTFDDGIKVVVKPTDFAANQIRLTGYSYGGHNRYPDSDRINIAYMNSVVPLGGLGSFDAMQLGKKLAGKNATATIWATDVFDRVEAGCAPKDLETMFQLIYLGFTAPRMDSVAFESFTTRMRNSLKDRDLNPSTAFGDTLKSAFYNNHPRAKVIVASDVDSINYERIMEMYKDRTSDISDFTFFIVGSVDLETLKPIVERYIGALPANGRKESIMEDGVKMRKGIYRNNFKRKMETPTGTELLVYSGEMAGTQKNAMLMSFLNQILNMVYTEEVREKEGGTYGVQVSGFVKKYPREEFTLSVQFSMAPERREELTAIVINELEKMRANGPKEEYLERVRSYVLKSFDESQKKNSAWMTWLYKYYFDNEDVYTDYKDMVNSITKEDVRLFLDEILKQGNMIEVSMVPEN